MFPLRFVFFPLRLLFYLYRKLRNAFGKKRLLLHSIPNRFIMNKPTSWLSALFSQKNEQNFFSYLGLLRILAQSDELEEIVYTIPDMEAPWHQVEEVTRMLHVIGRSGKKLIAYTNGGDLKTLYLMTPAHRRYSSEYANFTVLLPSFETYFAKKALDRLGVNVEIQNAGLYKSGSFEMLTRNTFSPQSRQSMSTLIQDMRQTLQKGFEDSCQLTDKAKKATLNLIKNQALIEAGELRNSGFLHKAVVSKEHLLEVILSQQTKPLYERSAMHNFDNHQNKDAQANLNANDVNQKASGKDKQLSKKSESELGRLENRLKLMRQTIDDNSIINRQKRKKFPLFKWKSTPSIAVVVMEGNVSLGVEEDYTSLYNLSPSLS